jgi:Recombination endonuclease VII
MPRKGPPTPEQKAVLAEQRRKRYWADPEKGRRTAQEWRRRNPDQLRLIQRRNHLRFYYGITPEEYDTILLAQGGGCGICGGPPNGRGVHYHVDHDHDTGRVRGLLCNRCNHAVGLLEDGRWLGAVAKYLGLDIVSTQDVRKQQEGEGEGG